ncbi:hypothetical protein [Kribbella sp. NBC_00359]|uniref:hypothetical protein n=1 Tax=Kribbella sp. NBC_00359 TaxID=2975966 RepID=UPI002E201742
MAIHDDPAHEVVQSVVAEIQRLYRRLRQLQNSLQRMGANRERRATMEQLLNRQRFDQDFDEQVRGMDPADRTAMLEQQVEEQRRLRDELQQQVDAAEAELREAQQVQETEQRLTDPNDNGIPEVREFDGDVDHDGRLDREEAEVDDAGERAEQAETDDARRDQQREDAEAETRREERARADQREAADPGVDAGVVEGAAAGAALGAAEEADRLEERAEDAQGQGAPEVDQDGPEVERGPELGDDGVIRAVGEEPGRGLDEGAPEVDQDGPEVGRGPELGDDGVIRAAGEESPERQDRDLDSPEGEQAPELGDDGVIRAAGEQQPEQRQQQDLDAEQGQEQSLRAEQEQGLRAEQEQGVRAEQGQEQGDAGAQPALPTAQDRADANRAAQQNGANAEQVGQDAQPAVEQSAQFGQNGQDGQQPGQNGLQAGQDGQQAGQNGQQAGQNGQQVRQDAADRERPVNQVLAETRAQNQQAGQRQGAGQRTMSQDEMAKSHAVYTDGNTPAAGAASPPDPAELAGSGRGGRTPGELHKQGAGRSGPSNDGPGLGG